MVKRKACWAKSLSPTLLKCGEVEFTTSPVRMATVLNEYFIDKVKNIYNGFQQVNSDPLRILRNLLSGWTNYTNVPVFKFKPISHKEVRKLI